MRASYQAQRLTDARPTEHLAVPGGVTTLGGGLYSQAELNKREGTHVVDDSFSPPPMTTQEGLPDLLCLSIPDLERLSRKHRNELGRRAPSGTYCLDKPQKTETSTSQVTLARNAFQIHPGEFEGLHSFMEHKVRQETYMGHDVPRKQCTFGPVKYKKYQLFDNVEEWPGLVKRVLEETVKIATQLHMTNPENYTGVHANLYRGQNDSVSPHADDEPQLVPGAPIFSFTFLKDGNNENARDFSIWKKPDAPPQIEGKGKIANITLFSGDLLIMQGDMQKYFTHGIEKARENVAVRINLTVRQFNPPKPNKHAGKRGRGADLET